MVPPSSPLLYWAVNEASERLFRSKKWIEIRPLKWRRETYRIVTKFKLELQYMILTNDVDWKVEIIFSVIHVL